MSEAVKKFFKRAPRYVLRPQDSKMLRLAPRDRRRHKIYEMEIIDISETGMGFIVDWHYLPSIGEILKVEFTVPAKDSKIAWYARVMRLEGPEERPGTMKHFSGVKVGVEFINMPKGHLEQLKKGIEQRLTEVTRVREVVNYNNQIERLTRILITTLWVSAIVAATAGFFYYITKYSNSYNPNRTANWGERFFEKTIPK